MALGLLPAEAAFASFGSEPVLLILGLLILTETLRYTGAVDALGGPLTLLIYLVAIGLVPLLWPP